MNKIINQVLSAMRVNGKAVPFAFLHYEGHDDTYITYQQMDADNSLSGDDELIGYADYYDFDIYSKGNYLDIVESVKNLLEQNGFEWQPSQTSNDLYEEDTGYFHKTLNFAYIRSKGDMNNG